MKKFRSGTKHDIILVIVSRLIVLKTTQTGLAQKFQEWKDLTLHRQDTPWMLSCTVIGRGRATSRSRSTRGSCPRRPGSSCSSPGPRGTSGIPSPISLKMCHYSFQGCILSKFLSPHPFSKLILFPYVQWKCPLGSFPPFFHLLPLISGFLWINRHIFPPTHQYLIFLPPPLEKEKYIPLYNVHRGEFIRSVWGRMSWRGEGNIMAVGKNITWKTGKGEAISTSRLLEKEGREAKRVL